MDDMPRFGCLLGNIIINGKLYSGEEAKRKVAEWQLEQFKKVVDTLIKRAGAKGDLFK